MYQMSFDGATVHEAFKEAVRWMADNEGEASLIVAVEVDPTTEGWRVTLFLDKSGK